MIDPRACTENHKENKIIYDSIFCGRSKQIDFKSMSKNKWGMGIMSGTSAAGQGNGKVINIDLKDHGTYYSFMLLLGLLGLFYKMVNFHVHPCMDRGSIVKVFPNLLRREILFGGGGVTCKE